MQPKGSQLGLEYFMKLKESINYNSINYGKYIVASLERPTQYGMV